MNTQEIIEKHLSPEAKDAVENFKEALKIVGIDDFVYSKVKDFPEIPGNGVYPYSGQSELHKGLNSLPVKYQDDLRKIFKDNAIPYVVIEQGDFVNYLVVNSDVNYEVRGSRGIARHYTLPQKNGMDFVGYAYVRNLAHPEYGLDHGNIGFANLGDAISRTM